MVQFDLGEGSPLDSRYRVARHTELSSQPVAGCVLNFRTCYDVTVWPLRVEAARFSRQERSAFNGRDGDVVAQLDLDLRVTGSSRWASLASTDCASFSTAKVP